MKITATQTTRSGSREIERTISVDHPDHMQDAMCIALELMVILRKVSTDQEEGKPSETLQCQGCESIYGEDMLKVYRRDPMFPCLKCGKPALGVVKLDKGDPS